MLFETIMILAGTVTALPYVFIKFGKALEEDEQIIAHFLEKPPTYSSAVQLVGELFRSDTGWTRRDDRKGSKFSTSITEHSHISGVKFTRHMSYGELSYTLYILDEEGKFQSVSTTTDENEFLRKELAAYQSRAENTRQRELSKLLARRVVSGAVASPVLGGSGTSGPPSSGEDALVSVSDKPTGLLTYDATSEQIVKIGGINSEPMNMAKELCKRYNLTSMAPSCNFVGTLYGVPITVEELRADKDLQELYYRETTRSKLKPPKGLLIKH